MQKQNTEAYAWDVETAFLHGKVEETIWKKIPDGWIEYWNNLESKVIMLKKTIYDLVQAEG